MAIILKPNKVNLYVSSVLFVFWYHSPNFLDTPCTKFIRVLYLNMFRASICPTSGEQCIDLPRMMCSTAVAGCGCVELGRQLCALWRWWFDWQSSATQPQPAIAVLHIVCSRTIHCSPDNGHIDA
jgi:hypothetical protein